MEGELEECSYESFGSYSPWDTKVFLSKEWCPFTPQIAESHFGIEFFALVTEQGYGDPLFYTCKKDSSGTVVQASFLFRHITRQLDWFEDILFYGRGKIPKGHRWVDHLKIDISYVTPPKSQILRCRTVAGFHYRTVKNRYLVYYSFWLEPKFKGDIPSKKNWHLPCPSPCEFCEGKITTLPSYRIFCIYNQVGKNISERHFKAPRSTFTARPQKFWLGQVPFRKVAGRAEDYERVHWPKARKLGLREGGELFLKYDQDSNVPVFIYDSTSSEEEKEDDISDIEIDTDIDEKYDSDTFSSMSTSSDSSDLSFKPESDESE